MNIVVSVLALIILGVGLYQQRNVILKPKKVTQITTPTVTKSAVLSKSTASGEIKEATPTAAKTPESKPTPKSPAPSSENNLEQFRYPGSTVVNSSPTSLSLESSDNPDSITNWYKDKLKSLGYNANSFVTTKSNDKIVNKLVSADGNTEIRVEITRNPGDSITKTTVTKNSP
ncbi:MAG: hypothetical protein UY21_C0001G0099 [Microgenomates group bacterium GW2011_GWA1_48_10]|nr:MAG: hypothetical protein UY21_C0001G0099 [Microgenomates group bacterium GW2011_GWA1_48_10]